MGWTWFRMMELVLWSSKSVSPTSLISELCRTSRALGGGRRLSSVSWSGPWAFGGVIGFPVCDGVVEYFAQESLLMASCSGMWFSSLG